MNGENGGKFAALAVKLRFLCYLLFNRICAPCANFERLQCGGAQRFMILFGKLVGHS